MKQTLFFVFIFCIAAQYSHSQEDSSFQQQLPGTDLSIQMKKIPGGTLHTGPSSSPQEIEIQEFWIAEHEITWGLYKLFLQREIDGEASPEGTNVTLEVDAISGATVPYVDMSLGMGTEDNLPVGNVTWLAATRFCKWLSALTGHFYRLPTEAEWEYAARAGSETTYFFGNEASELGKYAWYQENSDKQYHPVKTKQPNSWGLYDMYGNVAEWTLNQYSEEHSIINHHKTVATKEYPITLRGGSFNSSAEVAASNGRIPSRPVWKKRDPQFPKSKWWFTDAPFVGFRIVRPATPPTEKDYSTYWPENIH